MQAKIGNTIIIHYKIFKILYIYTTKASICKTSNNNKGAYDANKMQKNNLTTKIN